jgi:hypothetical protein
MLKFGAAAGLVLAAATASRAEEIDKKFRIGFSLGDYHTSAAIHSAAANRRALFLPNGELDDIIFDPRNDSGAISNFTIEPQLGAVLSASYAVSRFWYVEGSVGYRDGTVGNVQLQAQFAGAQIPTGQSFNFSIFNLDGGTITQVPLEFTAGVRFRPKATFNPYLCAGFGYTFMSYSPSDDMNQLSKNLDQSAGGFARISGTLFGGGEGFNSPTTVANLGGITVQIEDAPEWHFGGGFEFTVKNRWAIFIDARYYTYSGKFGMTVNGGSELGISVPNDQALVTDADAFGPFGSILVTQGGLVDGGSFVPEVGAPPGTDCAANGNINCVFTGPPDGVPDPGYYYIQAGDLRYNGASIQIGFKYTF